MSSNLYRLLLTTHVDNARTPASEAVCSVYSIDRRPANATLANLLTPRQRQSQHMRVSSFDLDSMWVIRLPQELKSAYSGVHNFVDVTTLPAFLTYLEGLGYTVGALTTLQVPSHNTTEEIWIRGS